VSAYEHIRAIRDGGGVVILDGAMGTELEARGARMDDDAWCGLVNLSDPGLVREVHKDHIRAGADVVITNTFMSGLGPMQRAGAADRFEAGIRSAIQAAREAVQSTASRPVAIAGSIGATFWGRPPVDRDAGRAQDAQLRDGYARQVGILADGGVDVLALEMVTDTQLGEAAVEAALESGLPIWLGLSLRVQGRDPSHYDSLPHVGPEARAVAEACVRDELDAVNIMHTDIHDVSEALEMLRPMWTGAVGVYPHHGLWARPHWTFADVPTDQLVELATDWIGEGVTMLGGCCGLRSHHITALRAAVDACAPEGST
jgi:S-methylmethionine-dependent homocysteine/selenocysteine methylase